MTRASACRPAKRKQLLRGIGAHVGAMCRIRPNALRAHDFQFDVTIDGRTLKMLNVIDEYTRECLAIEVGRSIDADYVGRLLDRLAVELGRASAFVRFDHGPEFAAHAIVDWCRFNNCDSVFIDPGSPGQNAWIESFNGRLRDELLNGRQWDCLPETRAVVEDWRIGYNINRLTAPTATSARPSDRPPGRARESFNRALVASVGADAVDDALAMAHECKNSRSRASSQIDGGSRRMVERWWPTTVQARRSDTPNGSIRSFV